MNDEPGPVSYIKCDNYKVGGLRTKVCIPIFISEWECSNNASLKKIGVYLRLIMTRCNAIHSGLCTPIGYFI